MELGLTMSFCLLLDVGMRRLSHAFTRPKTMLIALVGVERSKGTLVYVDVQK